MQASLAFTLTDETFAVNITDHAGGHAPTSSSMIGVGVDLVDGLGRRHGALGACSAALVGDPARWGVGLRDARHVHGAARRPGRADRRHVVVGRARRGRSRSVCALVLPGTWFIVVALDGRRDGRRGGVPMSAALRLGRHRRRWRCRPTRCASLPITVLSRLRIPRPLERWLSFVPVSVMAALVAGEVAASRTDTGCRRSQNPYLFAALPTALVYYKTRSLPRRDRRRHRLLPGVPRRCSGRLLTRLASVARGPRSWLSSARSAR